MEEVEKYRYEPSTAKNHYISSKEYTVFALDKAGTRQLAVGSNVVPSSLALAGSTLYWAQGGQAFSELMH